ncbi:MAG: iron chelate uptake ABC transporter family permease subunit [Candidatus Mycalebacterium zealandia]|nr:MAG: iron chelate uptake ABC transporter family permease subunit [Candidatus Mycalebacterium zealandia]
MPEVRARMWIFSELFSNYTVAVVVCGAIFLGLTAGACGTVVFVRKETLLADAVSHGCLPGIALGFMVAQGKSPSMLLVGALLTAFVTVGFVRLARSVSAVRFDSALAMGVSISFGVGIVLLTAIQSSGASGQAGLDRFLFGQASAMSLDDVKTIFIMGAVCALSLAVFWKHIKIVCFDREYAESSGFSVRAVGFFLNAFLVAATVIGIETVGVVLMCSMMVAPAIAARHLTDTMGKMTVLAALIGAVGGVLGVIGSWKIDNLPTGPAIVVCVTVAALAAILFSPKNGILARRARFESAGVENEPRS